MKTSKKIIYNIKKIIINFLIKNILLHQIIKKATIPFKRDVAFFYVNQNYIQSLKKIKVRI